MTHVRDINAAEFSTAVLQRSREVPVVVDFWAAWCQPCKVLGPTLEKLADDYDGAFELVKIDVDHNQELSVEYGVRGIPNVIAFRDGRPISQFTGVLPEQAVRQWIDELLPTEADGTAELAAAAAADGDTIAAEALFREALAEVPDHEAAGAGLAALLIAAGRTDEALDVLAKLGPTPEAEKLAAAARLTAAGGADMSSLEHQIEADPGDSRARIDLAQALASQGEYETALEQLLAVAAEKDDCSDEARRAMLDVFEVLGPEHELTPRYRAKLASALF